MAISCAWRSATASRAFALWSSSRPTPVLTLRSAAITRRRFDWSAPCAISMAPIRLACRIPGPGWTMAAGRGERTSAAMSSCPPKAKDCIRFQSVRSMPVSSSLAISVSPQTARRWRLEERLVPRASRLFRRRRYGARRAPVVARRATARSLCWPTPAPSRRHSLAGTAAGDLVAGRHGRARAHGAPHQRRRCNLQRCQRDAIHAQCALQREDVLATSQVCFGHRLMMDCVVPGGVAADLSSDGIGRVRSMLGRLAATRPKLGVSTTRCPRCRIAPPRPASSRRHWSVSMPPVVSSGAHRARFDARKSFAYAPYDGVDFSVRTRSAGDADARLLVRLDETDESVLIVGQLLDGPAGRHLQRAAGAWAEGARPCRGVPRRCLRKRAPCLGWPVGPRARAMRAGSSGRCSRPPSRATSWPTPALQQIVQLLLLGHDQRTFLRDAFRRARRRSAAEPGTPELEEVARALGERRAGGSGVRLDPRLMPARNG